MDYSKPIDPGAFYKNLLRPALEAVGLPATDPPRKTGLRCAVCGYTTYGTFATLRLLAGVHLMQVSKWLGHSTFKLTLDVHADYIPEQDGSAANTLPEPGKPAETADIVVDLFGVHTGSSASPRQQCPCRRGKDSSSQRPGSISRQLPKR